MAIINDQRKPLDLKPSVLPTTTAERGVQDVQEQAPTDQPETALGPAPGRARTGGRRQDAARLLGWGRNTLTRKIKELDMES